jgi:cell division protein FtsB
MAKIKLKNSDILEFYQTLTMINGVKNTNFNFCKAQNKASLQRKADPLTETQKEVFAHIEKYNQEHTELLKKYATKTKTKILK